jgi:serine/threonine protein kinase
MPLSPGTRFGSYEIVAPLGAGGMGEVYKARDTRLNRFVAIKVLPPERMADERRKQRFIREAQTASALNHPNIITVHDIAIDNGRDYLVMEYVSGKTLDELIPRTGMRLRELLKIAMQVAEGLSAAHAAGIIHRDLKPSNIMVPETGLVKLLDFGLAKLNEPREDDVTQTLKPTTEAGTVMGTAAYMSPEQAECKHVDARSDIFSFGAVLYEMGTGHRAFPGDSQAATLAAVLKEEPKPLSEVAPALPQDFERIVMRCLRKDIGKRQQNLTDVKLLLEELREDTESGKMAAVMVKSPRPPWPLVAAGVALVVTAVATVLWLTRGREPEPPRLVPLTIFAGSEDYPSFSPDGNQVVFAWNGEKQDNWDLYVKIIGSNTALRLTTDSADDLFPAWSPDGKQIAFFKRGQQRGIYLISPLGGPEQKVVDFDAADGAPAWSPDGRFLLAAKSYEAEKPEPGAGALFLIPVRGGEPRPLLTPESGWSFSYPALAFNGRSLAVSSCQGPWILRLCDVALVSLGSDLLPQGRPRRLQKEGRYIAGLTWTPDGRSLVLSTSSAPNIDSSLWRLDVEGRQGKRRLEIASEGACCPAVALKGNRLAFSRRVVNPDIWRLDLGGTATGPQPFLVSSMSEGNAQFSPDGRHIAFASNRSAEGNTIWLANADGAGLLQLTGGPEDYSGSPRWSPDGRWIAFDARNNEGQWNIKVVESTGGKARQFTNGAFNSHVPSWSHDGRWIYFNSDRSGRTEIWRAPAEGGPSEQITHDGGYVASESTDATTLYYTKSATGVAPLYAQPLAGGAERQVLDQVTNRGFVVLEDGIYYLASMGAERNELRFLEFATDRSRVISSIPGQLSLGLSVSQDRQTFLFTKVTSTGSDLMLIENFH